VTGVLEIAATTGSFSFYSVHLIGDRLKTGGVKHANRRLRRPIRGRRSCNRCGCVSASFPSLCRRGGGGHRGRAAPRGRSADACDLRERRIFRDPGGQRSRTRCSASANSSRSTTPVSRVVPEMSGPLVTSSIPAASARAFSSAARASSNDAACCGARPEASSEDNSAAAVSPAAGAAYRTMNAVAAPVRRTPRNAYAKSARVLSKTARGAACVMRQICAAPNNHESDIELARRRRRTPIGRRSGSRRGATEADE
jgi:hypothetical protein